MSSSSVHHNLMDNAGLAAITWRLNRAGGFCQVDLPSIVLW